MPPKSQPPGGDSASYPDRASALAVLSRLHCLPRSHAQQPVLLDAMTTELHRAFTSLGKQGPGNQEPDKLLPPYFLSYSVSDASMVSIRAQYGALVNSSTDRIRVADVQVRLGDPASSTTPTATIAAPQSTACNCLSSMTAKHSRAPYGRHQCRLRHRASTTTFASRLKRRSARKKKTPRLTSAKNRHRSPSTNLPRSLSIDRAAWEKRVRDLSRIFRDYPDVYQNIVMLTVQNETDYFASSEGSRVVTPHLQARLVVLAATRADDGMDLFRDQTFEAETVDGLPSQADLESAIRDARQKSRSPAQSARHRALRRPRNSLRSRLRCLLPRSARPPP